MALFAFAILAFSVVVPRKAVGGLALGVDDLLVGILVVWLAAFFIRNVSTRWSALTMWVGILWIAIILHGLLLGFVASFDILGQASPPTEMWQYVKRMTFFYVAFVIASQGFDSASSAYRILFCAILLAGLVGLAQIPPGAAGEAIASLYARTDAQLENLVGKELGFRRTYGVAGHAVAWGGFCVLMGSLAVPWLTDGSRARRDGQGRWRLAALLLVLVALLNLAYAASRAAIVAFVTVVMVAGLVELFIRRDGASGVFRWSLLVLSVPAAALAVVGNRIKYLAVRFDVLSENLGGDRIEQVRIGTQLLDSYGAWFSGVGNAVQRLQGVSYGVEVEPVYLVVNYGIVGAAMRYALLGALAYMALRGIRHEDARIAALNMGALLLVCGYLVFSMGYFFFQELVVGATPWLLFGLVAGSFHYQWARAPARRPGRSTQCLRSA